MKSSISRRALLGGLGAIGASAALAACGATPTPQVIKEVTKEVEKVGKETVLVEQPTVAATGQKASVTYWNYMTQMEKIETPILEAFKAANPDIKVDYQYIVWDQYWQKLNATLSAGNPPDVWNTGATYYYEYILRKQLLDLSDLIKRDVDTSDFHKSTMVGLDLEGRYYGLPRDLVFFVTFFNKDLFDQAGVQPPPLDGNWTWKDYLEKAVALTSKEGDKTVNWGGEALGDGLTLDQIMFSNGGNPFKGEFRRDLKGMSANYDDPISCEVFTYQAELVTKQKTSPPSGEFEGQGNSFLTGKIAMANRGTWEMVDLKDAKFSWDITTIPKGSQSQRTYGGSDALVISSPAKDRIEPVWKLALWVVDAKTSGEFIRGTGLMPITKSGLNSDLVTGPWGSKNTNALLAAADTSYGTETLGLGERLTAEGDELAKMFAGTTAGAEGCGGINKAVNDAIDRIRTQFQEVIGA